MPSRRKQQEVVLDPFPFVEGASRFVAIIRHTTVGVRYGSAHYRALDDLAKHVADTIREISGEEVPWLQPHRAPGAKPEIIAMAAERDAARAQASQSTPGARVTVDAVLCEFGGNARYALAAALEHMAFLEMEIRRAQPAVSVGFTRGWRPAIERPAEPEGS